MRGIALAETGFSSYGMLHLLPNSPSYNRFTIYKADGTVRDDNERSPTAVVIGLLQAVAMTLNIPRCWAQIVESGFRPRPYPDGIGMIEAIVGRHGMSPRALARRPGITHIGIIPSGGW